MKVTTTTQVAVDGVMQGNGGASDEDRRSGFERGGWARPPKPLFDDEAMTFVEELYQRAEAAIAELKAKPGGELQVHGSGALTRWLLDNELVDEMNLSSSRWSSVGAGGCSPTPVRTLRSTWSSRERSRGA